MAISISRSGSARLRRRSVSPHQATSITSVPRISPASTPARSAGSSGSEESALRVMARDDPGYKRTGNLREHREDLVERRGRCIGDKNDVLVADRKPVGEKIGIGVGEIEA